MQWVSRLSSPDAERALITKLDDIVYYTQEGQQGIDVVLGNVKYELKNLANYDRKKLTEQLKKHLSTQVLKEPHPNEITIKYVLNGTAFEGRTAASVFDDIVTKALKEDADFRKLWDKALEKGFDFSAANIEILGKVDIP